VTGQARRQTVWTRTAETAVRVQLLALLPLGLVLVGAACGRGGWWLLVLPPSALGLVAHARLVARAGVRTLAQTAGTLLVLAAVASVALLVIGPALGLYRTVTVLSGSMTPTFSPGDVIVVTPQPASTLRVGEVITYQIPVENEPVETHRVMQILEHGREPIVRTKGDANRTRDPWTARLHGGTVWRYRFRVPALGYALLELRQPLVRRLLVLVPTLVLLGFGLARVWLPVPRRDVRTAP